MAKMDGEKVVNLSRSNLDLFPDVEQADIVSELLLQHNRITILPRCICDFQNLTTLNISNNGMTYLSPELCRLTKLKTLVARNNYFENVSLPKELALMQSLEVVNLSGNQLTEFPKQLTQLPRLRALFLGANNIKSIPSSIGNLTSLKILYLGGNCLQQIPFEIGLLSSLVSLILADNRLKSLPPTFASLQHLESLNLHNNQLSILPPEIVTLNLVELSLRNNPLVVRFVQDLVFEPPSLLELAGRVVKVRNVGYSASELPHSLRQYLDTAQRCVNPKCKGVYFTSKVKHVKFVDFCGKYHIPLQEYLCSPTCTTYPAICSSSSEDESEEEVGVKIKKVLLG